MTEITADITGGTGVQIVTVSEDDDEIRLDKWFARHFPGLPKTQLYKMMRKGDVRVAGKRVKPNARVQEGQEVRVPPMPESAYQPFETRDTYSNEQRQKDKEFLKSCLIYQDKHVFVFNKPFGVATQGGSKIKHHIDGALRAFETDTVKPKLVHRLDKETTGVLVVAKNAKVARDLGYCFKQRETEKYYWAVVCPSPQMEAGVIEAHIAKGKTRGGERVMVDNEEGKYSKTEYWVVERAYTKAAFICFKPETGRTHQLRVHASIIGCPILGDQKYFIENEHEEQDIDMSVLEHANKLHLHARQIKMPHPSGQGMLDVTAAIPEHMANTFKYFEFDENAAEDIEE